MRTIIFSLLCFGVFHTSFSVAAMKDIIVDETRVSALDASKADDIVIFGGATPCNGQAGCTESTLPVAAGDGFFGECTTLSGTSTCNSCTGMTTVGVGGGDFQRCAYRSVYGSLVMRFTMTPDTISGTSTVKAQIVAGNATQEEIVLTSPPTPAAGQPFTVEIPWNDICLKAIGGRCDGYGVGIEDSFVATLYIGIGDGNLTTANAAKFTIRWRSIDGVTPDLVAPNTCGGADPFCAFKVSPGDEKVYVSDILRGTIGPAGDSGVKWTGIRVFHAVSECVPGAGAGATCGAGQPDFAAINVGNGAEYEDLAVTSKTDVVTSLGSNKITSGLQNEVSYKFNIATVDETTIVDGFLDPALLNSTDHAATPGQVVGLLDDKKCFIATAAFGSPMEPQVQVLRQFRNQYLLTNVVGRWFVKTYYRFSPPVANFISHHENLRTAVRWALAPVISTAEFLMSLKNPEKSQEQL